MTHLDVLEQIAVFATGVHMWRLGRTRVDRIRDDRQWLVVHLDQLHGLLCKVGACRSDEGDRIAHVANGLVFTNQHRPIQRDEAMDIFSRDVRPGEHRVHARQGAGPAGVDAQHQSVRIRRTQRPCIDHVREDVIICVLRASCDAVDNIGNQLAMADTVQRLVDGRLVWRQGLLAAQEIAGGMNSAHYAAVAGAAAIGVLERDLYGVVVRLGILLQQGGGGHHQAGRAEATLYGAMIDELLLQRVQLLFTTGVTAGQPLNRAHRLALCLEGRINTGIDRHTIHVHGANAAFSLVTSDLGAGQTEVIAQHPGQGARFRHIQVVCNAINCQLKGSHGLLSMSKLAKPNAFGLRNPAARPFDGQRQDLIEEGFDHM